ncbi:MAG: hypothetical protein ACU843_16680 [Gammaproteobacteria bacterium]
MKLKIAKAIGIGAVMLGTLGTGTANAFVLFEDLGLNQSNTDVWQIVCPSTGAVATNTAKLNLNITDLANVVKPSLISATIFKTGSAINTTDPIDGLQATPTGMQSLPSPTVTLTQGNGTYFVLVTHTVGTNVPEGYSASGECQNAFGVPLNANSVTLIQDQ